MQCIKINNNVTWEKKERPHPSAPTSKIQHHFSHPQPRPAQQCINSPHQQVRAGTGFFWRFLHLHLRNSGFYCPWYVLWAGVQDCLFGVGCDLTEDDLCWRLFHCLMWALPWTPIFLHCRWSKRPSTMEVESSLGRKLCTSDCTVIFLFQSALLTVLEDGKSREIQNLQKLINWAFQIKARKLWQKEGQHHSPSLPHVSAKFILFIYSFIYF